MWHSLIAKAVSPIDAILENEISRNFSDGFPVSSDISRRNALLIDMAGSGITVLAI